MNFKTPEEYSKQQMSYALSSTNELKEKLKSEQKEREDYRDAVGTVLNKDKHYVWKERAAHFLTTSKDSFFLLKLSFLTLLSSFNYKSKFDYKDDFIDHEQGKVRKALRDFFANRVSKEQISNAIKDPKFWKHLGSEMIGTLAPPFEPTPGALPRTPEQKTPYIETENPFATGRDPRDLVKGDFTPSEKSNKE